MVTYEPSSWPNRWNRDSLSEGQFAIKTDSAMSSCRTVTFAWFEGGCNEVWVVNAAARDEEPMNSSLLQ